MEKLALALGTVVIAGTISVILLALIAVCFALMTNYCFTVFFDNIIINLLSDTTKVRMLETLKNPKGGGIL